MTGSEMLAEPPSPRLLRTLGIQADETYTVATEEIWWRVHRTDTDHALAWNALRTFGPLLRFDPHPLPKGEHLARGVWYGASTPDAALAEAYQVDRTIDRELGRPYLTGVSFTRSLTVLDLATDIVEAFPELDGLRYNSRCSGRACLALFTPARTAMPDRPALSLPLSHPGLAGRIAGAARRLGYGVV